MESTSRHTADLSLNTEVVRKLLVGFLHDEITQAGFTKGVLGLSGGVDSALALALAVEALGRENVVAVMMPYASSSPESRAHAELAASRLGVIPGLVEITPMVDAFLNAAGPVERVRAGNVMARQRMIVLYDVSAREKALVIGTSNKTEILLGYGTLHGDLACAVNPLGDLYKTQVWQLAAAMGVPKEIVEKEPSADLWAGQTDEGEFGFTYRDVDRLLYAMVDDRRTPEEIAAMGFDPAFVRRVAEMIRRFQFKRRPPLIAKVSHRTVNVDFRYARDWGI
jgi:NAD+ synthase